MSSQERTARCLCGGLKAVTLGEPIDVYACSCADCQRKSGSVFTYAAIFPDSAVTLTGQYKSYRRQADSGSFLNNAFCPTCGVGVFFRAEAVPGVIGIAVGCFAEARFAKPARVYWASRRHHWLAFDHDTPLIETQ